MVHLEVDHLRVGRLKVDHLEVGHLKVGHLKMKLVESLRAPRELRRQVVKSLEEAKRWSTAEARCLAGTLGVCLY